MRPPQPTAVLPLPQDKPLLLLPNNRNRSHTGSSVCAVLSVLRHVSPVQLYRQQLPIRSAIVRQLLQAGVACTAKHLHGTVPDDGFGALLRCASILAAVMSSGSQQRRWAELACQVPGVQRFLHRCIAQLVQHCQRSSRDWHQALGAAFDLLFDLMAAGSCALLTWRTWVWRGCQLSCPPGAAVPAGMSCSCSCWRCRRWVL